MNGVPTCDDDGFATGWEVITASRRFHHRLEVSMDQCLEHLGMTFAQHRALETLAANKDMRVSDLARRLRVTRQAARAVVKKLDRGELVETVAEDGRLYVGPSQLGRERLRHCRKVTESVQMQLESELTQGERHRLLLFLERAGLALESPSTPEWWLAP